MGVVQHADPDAFLAGAEPLLARNPAVRAFVTAWTRGWRDAVATRPPVVTYAATCAIGAAHGLALLREGPVVIENSDADAAVALAADLAAKRIGVDHVIGEQAGCVAFAGAWQALTRRGHVEAMHLRHLMLTALDPAPPTPGAMRHARDDDLPWLVEHSLLFAQDARLPDRPDQVITLVERRHAQRRFRIWEAGGRVAFAASVDAGAADGRIGLVYTVRTHRRRGYAAALVTAVVREQLAAGKQRLFLTTDAANTTSNAIYARLGFRVVSEAYRFDFLPAAAAP
jgi:RimJ/RimL family protein N-acetyltransferase